MIANYRRYGPVKAAKMAHVGIETLYRTLRKLGEPYNRAIQIETNLAHAPKGIRARMLEKVVDTIE
jgi:DNA-binding phage protein